MRRLSPASGALRPLCSSRYSLARASAASSGPWSEPGLRCGDSRGEPSGEICYLLPAPHPRTNCTPVPPGQVRKAIGVPSPQAAWPRTHTGRSGPPPPPPFRNPRDYSPAGACVGPVPFSSRGGLRKGSNSTSSSSAACSHLSGSVSGGGSRGRRTRTAQGNLLRTNSAPALAAEAESFIIVRPTPPGDWPQGRARARLRRRRG